MSDTISGSISSPENIGGAVLSDAYAPGAPVRTLAPRGPVGPPGTTEWEGIENKPETFPPTIGGGSDEAVAGDDPRLSDAREPTLHKHRHSSGGDDELTVEDIGAAPVEHVTDSTNPHSVTADQVGLGNVDNTSDLDKPISTDTQSALDLKSDVGHGHAVADITDLTAEAVPYDNLKIQNGIGLEAINVQDAIDELEIEKLNIRDAGTNIILFPTSTTSDISGYNAMVVSTVDPRYDISSIDISTGPITASINPDLPVVSQGQIVGSLISDPGIIVGAPGLVNITTIGNIRKSNVQDNRNAVFYYKIFKYIDDVTPLEFLCASDPTPEVTSGTYRQFAESALLPINATFTETDRIVIIYYGVKTASGGNDPAYEFEFGGDDPVRTLLPVPASVAIMDTWRKTGDDIYYELGNVGIGKSDPNEALDVDGNIVASGAISGSNLSGTNTGDQDLSGLVPYSGATASVDLGSQSLSAGTITSNGDTVATVVDPARTTLSGDGITTVFAINGASGIVNPSALIVAIDGVLQEPVADYTVSSGNITFSEPVPNGSKAVVISPTNTIQVANVIPSDGSVTSEKLASDIEISGQLTAPNQVIQSGDSIINFNILKSRETVTYHGGQLVQISVFNGGTYTLQDPANYWQRGILLRRGFTDAVAIPIPQHWDAQSVMLRVSAARNGGTASLKDFVLRERSRFINNSLGEFNSNLSDFGAQRDVLYSFSGSSNSTRIQFDVEFNIRPQSDNESRQVSLQRLSDPLDTMDTSLIIYQVIVKQL
jgi:hypothetical protein